MEGGGFILTGEDGSWWVTRCFSKDILGKTFAATSVACIWRQGQHGALGQ